MLLFHHLAREGASPETIPEAERRRGRCRRTGIRPFGPGPGNRERLARRPRTGLVTPRSGGPGLAVRWHYDRLPSMAGRDGDEGWRKLPGSGVPKALRVSCPEAWRPGTEKPPVERREAPSRLASGKDTPRSVSSGRAGRSRGLANPCVSRRSAPPSSAEARRAKADRAGDKGMTAFPGPIKNTGDGARLRLSLPCKGRITKEPAPHARIATIPAPVGRHLLLLYHRLTGRRGTAPLPCGCHILWLTICQ